MTGTRSSFVLLVILASHAVLLTPVQAQEKSGGDAMLRQRAEDLAREASERFTEILSGETGNKVAQGAEGKPLNPIWDWLGQASRAYRGVIITKLRNPSGEVAILVPPGGAAPKLPTTPAASEIVHESEPRLGWTYLVESVREWLARANRSYRTEVVKKLAKPQTGTPSRTAGAAPQPEAPALPEEAPPQMVAAPQADAAGGVAATSTETKSDEKRKAEVEAKRKAEAEAKRKAEAEAETKRKAEATRKAEAQAAAKRKSAAEAKRKAEAEAAAKRKAEAEAKRKAEAEAEAKRKAEAEAAAKRKAEAETKRKAEAQTAAKRKAAAEAKRKEEAEAAAKRKAAAEAKRRAATVAEAKRKADAKRLAEEEAAEEKAVAAAKRMAAAMPKEPPVTVDRKVLPTPPERKAPGPTDRGAPKARSEPVVSEPPPPPEAKSAKRSVSKRHYRKRRLRRHARVHRAHRAHRAHHRRHRHAHGYRRRHCGKRHRYRRRAVRGWSGRIHVVRRGDTLTKISRRYYGTASGYRRIYRANRGKVRNPNLIYPRQRLYIPYRRR